MTDAAGLDGGTPDNAGAAAAGAVPAQPVEQVVGDAAAAEPATTRFGKARRVAMFVAYVGDGYSVGLLLRSLPAFREDS